MLNNFDISIHFSLFNSRTLEEDYYILYNFSQLRAIFYEIINQKEFLLNLN
jgi:hypothetical protein